MKFLSLAMKKLRPRLKLSTDRQDRYVISMIFRLDRKKEKPYSYKTNTEGKIQTAMIRCVNRPIISMG